MTLPASGPISFDDINVELGKPVGTTMSLNDADVRELAGVPTGPVTLPDDFWGKSHDTLVTVTEGSANQPLRYGYINELAVHQGSVSPGSVFNAVIVNIYLYSTGFQPYIRNFKVTLNGNRPKSHFSSIDIQGYGNLTSASAAHAYSSAFNQTSWEWTSIGVGPNPWGFGWDGTGTRTVMFHG